jgi:hypothetical protein
LLVGIDLSHFAKFLVPSALAPRPSRDQEFSYPFKDRDGTSRAVPAVLRQQGRDVWSFMEQPWVAHRLGGELPSLLPDR